MQGQTYTHKLGTCCHEPEVPRYSMESFPPVRGEHNAFGGDRQVLLQHGYTSGLWSENRGEKNQSLRSWAKKRPMRGVGAAAEGPHATILLIVLSEPITRRRRLAEQHPQERCGCLDRMGGRCKGYQERRCTSVSCGSPLDRNSLGVGFDWHWTSPMSRISRVSVMLI